MRRYWRYEDHHGSPVFDLRNSQMSGPAPMDVVEPGPEQDAPPAAEATEATDAAAEAAS